jgi:hypothetical protein
MTQCGFRYFIDLGHQEEVIQNEDGVVTLCLDGGTHHITVTNPPTPQDTATQNHPSISPASLVNFYSYSCSIGVLIVISFLESMY